MLESIKKWDEKETNEGLSDDDRVRRMAAKDDYRRAVEMKEIMWK